MYLVFLALDLLLDLDVEDGVCAGDLGVAVQLDARRAQQLGAVQALGAGLAVLAVDHLADVAEWVLRRTLPTDHLATTQPTDTAHSCQTRHRPGAVLG